MTRSDRHDVVVVGAGLLGIATALRLLERDASLRVLVYAPGSLKARLCVQGAAE